MQLIQGLLLKTDVLYSHLGEMFHGLLVPPRTTACETGTCLAMLGYLVSYFVLLEIHVRVQRCCCCFCDST